LRGRKEPRQGPSGCAKRAEEERSDSVNRVGTDNDMKAFLIFDCRFLIGQPDCFSRRARRARGARCEFEISNWKFQRMEGVGFLHVFRPISQPQEFDFSPVIHIPGGNFSAGCQRTATKPAPGVKRERGLGREGRVWAGCLESNFFNAKTQRQAEPAPTRGRSTRQNVNSEPQTARSES
jgi:hypothetical protein